MSEWTALYRWFNRSGMLLYVGISNNVVRRAGEHEESKDWWQSVVRAEVDHFPSREAALNAERRAIREEFPVHNIQHNGAMQYVAPEERHKTQRHLRSLNESPGAELVRLLRSTDLTPGQRERIKRLRVCLQRIEEAPPGMHWHKGGYVPDIRSVAS